MLIAMCALAAIEAMGDEAASLHPLVAQMKTAGPSPDGRYRSYVPRLIQNIVPNAKPEAGTAKPKRKKAE